MKTEINFTLKQQKRKKEMTRTRIRRRKLKNIPKPERKKGMNYDLVNMEDPTKKVDTLPEGSWIPISIAAKVAGCSSQMIRFLYMNKVVDAIKFDVGPILINATEIKEKYKKSRYLDV